jgi:hypothetical protein
MTRVPWVIALALLSGCMSDTATQLTAPTSDGSDTFSCRVDGNVWKASVPLLYTLPPVGAMFNQGQLGIEGVRKDDNVLERIEFLCDSVKGTGEQTVISASYLSDTTEYYIPRPGSVKVYLTRFDTVNQIASGTFAFEVADDASHVAHVTDGRFDVRLNR